MRDHVHRSAGWDSQESQRHRENRDCREWTAHTRTALEVATKKWSRSTACCENRDLQQSKPWLLQPELRPVHSLNWEPAKPAARPGDCDSDQPCPARQASPIAPGGIGPARTRTARYNLVYRPPTQAGNLWVQTTLGRAAPARARTSAPCLASSPARRRTTYPAGPHTALNTQDCTYRPAACPPRARPP
jgi:hypothetical protein